MNRRKVALLIVGLLIVSTSVFASYSRIIGLGSPHGLIEDDTDIYLYPSTMNQYEGVVVGELFNTPNDFDWTIGANVPIENVKIGLYLNQPTGINFDDNEHLFGLDISRSTNLMIGFMEKIALGFGTAIDYKDEVKWTNGDETKKLDPKANFYKIFGGYSTGKVDFGVNIDIADAENVDDGTKAEYSKMIMDINARTTIINNSKMTLIAKAGFSNISEEYDYSDFWTGDQGMSTDLSEINVDISAGLQVKAGEKNKIFIGLTPFRYSSATLEEKTPMEIDPSKDSYVAKDEYKLDAMVFPAYYLAVESQICSWLTGRFGANQDYVHVTQEADYDEESNQEDEDTEFYEKEYNMNLGLTFKFGNFCIDSVIEKELLFDGPNFIGGRDSGLASNVSVKYKF